MNAQSAVDQTVLTTRLGPDTWAGPYHPFAEGR